MKYLLILDEAPWGIVDTPKEEPNLLLIYSLIALVLFITALVIIIFVNKKKKNSKND